MARFSALVVCVLLSASGCARGSTPLDEYTDALGGGRRLIGRLAESRHYSPYRDDFEPVDVGALDADVLAKYLKLSDLSGRERDAHSLRVAGSAEMLVGRVPDAIGLLTEAMTRSPHDWRVWNDLAVAHLASFSDSGSALPLVHALDAALEAATLASDEPQPWFNVLVAAAQLNLRPVVSDALGRLAQTSDVVQWQREAVLWSQSAGAGHESPLEGLRKSAGSREPVAELTAYARSQPGHAAESLISDVFPAWSAAVRSGDTEGARVFSIRSQQVAEAVREATGDPQFVQCAADLSHVFSSLDPRARDATASAFLELGYGRASYEENRREEANVHYQRAADAFALVSSPCEMWLDLEQGISLSLLGARESALMRYTRVAEAAREAGFYLLYGRAQWLAGIALLREGRTAHAQRAFDQSIQTYDRIGDRYNGLAARSAAAEAMRVVGAHQEGWAYLTPALLHVNQTTLRRQYLVSYNGALFSADAGLPRAALAFQVSAVTVARARGVSNTVVEGLIQRARRHAILGDAAAADRDLSEAEARLSTVESRSSEVYLRAWLRHVRAGQQRDTDPEAVFRHAGDDLLSYFSASEPWEVQVLHATRADAWERLGQPDPAIAELRSGVEAFEKFYAGVSSERHRVLHLDASAELFDRLMRLHLAAGRLGEVFAIAERAREAAFRSRTAGSPIRGLSQVAAGLPADAALVYFAQLDHALIRWSAGRSGVEVGVIDVSRLETERLVSAFRAMVEGGRSRAELDVLGAELFASLFDQSWLERNKVSRLLLVPDGPLHALPFAALPTPSGGPLAQSYSVSMLPSARSALTVAQTLSRPGASESSVLVVGDAFTPSAVPELPGARKELAAVAARYRRSRILTGPAATPTAFAAAAPLADIVHFAGHAEADFRSPWSAFLQLSTDPTHPDGRVRIEDLERWRLPSTRLVVLSGCETSLGRVFRGQGMVNLARPFLGAGAHAVVGTLWKVDDDTARLLMSEFHRHFSAGLDAPTSLRRAQTALLTSANPTHAAARSWSGFVLVEAR